MTHGLNCWEFMECGREPGGARVEEMGVCPTATTPTFDGYNGGTNGGRSCWLVAGTYCEGEVQGTFAAKFRDCFKCEFHKLVMEEERQKQGT